MSDIERARDAGFRVIAYAKTQADALHQAAGGATAVVCSLRMSRLAFGRIQQAARLATTARSARRSSARLAGHRLADAEGFSVH
jgi:hypothetical protein